MQKKRQYLLVVSQIVCLLVVTAMLGCGDTQKRTSGKKLRTTTKQAKKHYDKAQSILSNYDDGYNNPEVLSALEAAEKLLINTLQENGTTGDAEDTPTGELVNARKMLGMVYQLRGMCNLWKIDAIVREVGVQENRTHSLLTKVQGLSAGAVSYKQSFLNNKGDIGKNLSKAKTDQKTLTDKTNALNSKIKTQAEDITALEKKIHGLSVKSASLRKKSTVNISREDSLRELREAQSVEKEIVDNEAILARKQRDLAICRDEMKILQIGLEAANGQVRAYQDRSLSMEKAEKERKSNLADSKNKIKASWENIVASQKSPLQGYPGASQRSLVQNCQLAVELTGQAEKDFDKANREFAAAGRIAENANAPLLDDQAEALVEKAMLMTRVMNLYQTIKKLSDRTQVVWKSMADIQMSITPVSPEITKFLSETGGMPSKIVDSYRQAVKFRESAVGKTRDPKLKLQYQRALANTRKAYALSLLADGKADQAATEMKKVEEFSAKTSKSN